ncbi:hypothetical protein WN944_001811 [Citrus x changshan-huyou]|uniref:Uncharacterized protein n=1 Tax=Citrus x changshan-huyou TaxID=2935761 RepID=A0AAP0MFF5_9ROSI
MGLPRKRAMGDNSATGNDEKDGWSICWGQQPWVSGKVVRGIITKPSSQIKPKVRAACRHDLTQVDYRGPQPRVRSKLTICNGPLSSPNKKNANGVQSVIGWDLLRRNDAFESAESIANAAE